MADHMLGKLVLRRIGVDAEACCQALEDGLVTAADLDKTNEVHVDGFQQWLTNIPSEELSPISPDWLACVKSWRLVMRLAPLMPEAEKRVTKAIRDGLISVDDLTWPESTYPTAWAKAIEKALLEKPDWDKFHAVQDKLPVDMSARLRKELAVKMLVIEQEAKEQRRLERAASKPRLDPLAESIRTRNASRLRKLPLAKLSRVRWEAHKEAWMKAPAEILAYAARVPMEFSRPYETKILEAVADQGWVMLPEWSITKNCLQELDIRHQASFLRQMFQSMAAEESVSCVDPELTWQEIRNVMVAATLQNPDNLNMSRWLDGLSTFKHLQSLKRNGTRISAAEDKQFRMAAPNEENYYNMSEWFSSPSDPDECAEIELALDLLVWVKSQPEEKQPCYGAILRGNAGFKELFGGALKINTAY